jgi:hypothetical protein
VGSVNGRLLVGALSCVTVRTCCVLSGVSGSEFVCVTNI